MTVSLKQYKQGSGETPLQVQNGGTGTTTLSGIKTNLGINTGDSPTFTGLNLTSSPSVQSATSIPAGGTTGAGILLSSTANFGVFFGSGEPTLSAAKGSLYLRSDGSTTNNRMYVNTDGTTSWTSVITAT